MSRSMINFTKGIITGVVVGTTVNMVIHSITKPANHSFINLKQKKGAGKMIKNVGEMVSHITDMMK